MDNATERKPRLSRPVALFHLLRLERSLMVAQVIGAAQPANHLTNDDPHR